MGFKRSLPAATDYERIFHPKRLAIIGVSQEGNVFGSGMILSLNDIGYSGEIYPVNPKGGTFAGLDIYRSVEEIPEEIDFAVIAVSARNVPEALDACRKKGAAGAEILSAGFKELGTPEGIALEEEIKRIAARGIRVVGPNCFGIYCPASGLTVLPGPDLSRKSGPLAFLAQSGGMSIDFAATGKWMGLNFSKLVSFGNGADLRETELLDYLGRDAATGIIAMYIEGIEEGDAFFSTLREVTRHKPVVIYKGGLSAAGQRAVTSHTASLGGNKAIWEAVLRQCGAVQVGNLWEMAETCLAFTLLPERVYRGMTVIGGGGALGVAACDAAEAAGVELPILSGEIHDRIMAVLPKPGSSAGNPIDIASPMVDVAMQREVLRSAASDDRVDIQLMIQLFYHLRHMAVRMGAKSVKEVVPYRELADMVRQVVDETGKPVVLILPNHKQDLQYLDIEEMMREARQAFVDRGIPVFDDLNRAFTAIGHVSDYTARKNGRTALH